MSKTVLDEKLCWYGEPASSEHWDAQWEKRFERALERGDVPSTINGILRTLPVGAKILEAGCGRGQVVNGLCRQGFRAEGIDLAPKTVRALLERGIPVKEMDVRDLEYPDNYFDAYLSFGVIEHFLDENDSQKVIKEAVRVTRPGGRLFFSVPFTNAIRERSMKRLSSLRVDLNDSIFYQRSYRRDQFCNLLKKFPLRIDKIGYENPVKGIKDELPSFWWLRYRLISAAITKLHSLTPILNPFAHMIYAKLTNIK